MTPADLLRAAAARLRSSQSRGYAPDPFRFAVANWLDHTAIEMDFSDARAWESGRSTVEVWDAALAVARALLPDEGGS